MTFGVIARADRTGLGVLGIEFVRNLCPAKVLGVDLEVERGYAADRSALPAGTIWTDGRPTLSEVDEFLDGLDSFLTFETEYLPGLFRIARARGVKSVLVVMPEYLVRYPRGEGPDLFVNPTRFEHDVVPAPKMVVPVPVALDRLKIVESTGPVRVVHPAGRIVGLDRNGTQLVDKAARLFRSRVETRSQTGRKGLDVEVANYWETLDGVDVAVLPRRYGGLCLPMQEGAARGIPFVMLDVPTYRDEGYPKDLLVSARPVRTRRMRGKLIAHYECSPPDLARTVNRLVDDEDQLDAARWAVRSWAEARSWEALGGWWRSIL